jgi:hypothetical protein
MKTGLPIKQADDNSGPPEYRVAGDPARSCGACAQFIGGTCKKFSVPVDHNFTCDAFTPRQMDTGPLSKLVVPIDPVTDPYKPTDFGDEEVKIAMTKEQAFKAGFLMRCAEEGLSDEQTHERIMIGLAMEKAALHPIAAALAPAVSGLGNIAVGLGVGLPVAAGIGGGYLAAKSTSDIDSDIDRLKERELTDIYNSLSEDAKSRARVKRKGLGLPSSGVVWQHPNDEGQNVKL